MDLIQSISSTLKTWVFKNRLLKFSSKFQRDPLACFYCPEMCRFSCPVTEALRLDTVTPRGKMSLLHLAERGFEDAMVTGDTENRLWVLEQCTGCGRCTEYCKWEVDVAANLRAARSKIFLAGAKAEAESADYDLEEIVSSLEDLNGRVLFVEPGRMEWWRKRLSDHPREMHVDALSDAVFPARQWGWGKLRSRDAAALVRALRGCSEIWVESPETAWFLAKGLGVETGKLKAPVRVVWQKYFAQVLSLAALPETVFHESFYLTRLFPRLGVSIPMYERGAMPFHSGWNVMDCGGEGYFQEAHPHHAIVMAMRFMTDLKKDGRKIEKIICQNLSCVEHLKKFARVPVTYWLDEIENGDTES